MKGIKLSELIFLVCVSTLIASTIYIFYAFIRILLYDKFIFQEPSIAILLFEIFFSGFVLIYIIFLGILYFKRRW